MQANKNNPIRRIRRLVSLLPSEPVDARRSQHRHANHWHKGTNQLNLAAVDVKKSIIKIKWYNAEHKHGAKRGNTGRYIQKKTIHRFSDSFHMCTRAPSMNAHFCFSYCKTY